MPQLGVPRDRHLTSAKDTWLLDCKAAGLSPKTIRGYKDALNAFIKFAGDMLVRELGPDHVRLYIAHLSDLPGRYEGENTTSSTLLKHYAVVRTWVRWMYAQKIIEDRITDYVKPPRLADRLPSILRRLTSSWITSCDGRITQRYVHLAETDLLEAQPIDRRTRSKRPKSQTPGTIGGR